MVLLEVLGAWVASAWLIWFILGVSILALACWANPREAAAARAEEAKKNPLRRLGEALGTSILMAVVGAIFGPTLLLFPHIRASIRGHAPNFLGEFDRFG